SGPPETARWELPLLGALCDDTRVGHIAGAGGAGEEAVPSLKRGGLADTRPVLAAILTIGNELVSGDVENTNASWLARRLESLGVRVSISASVPDELERIVEFVRREREPVDHLIVTGGLGGTPDDITREALAAAFDAPQESVPALEADLRARFTGDPDYVARWAALPRGSRPLENPLGGAPGFRIANTWV